MKYFGTDGFRGEANVTLNAVHAYKVGRFLGHFYSHSDGKGARVVIGKDTRQSGYMFENALAAGLTASGADVYLLGYIPTPGVAYAIRDGKFDCGVMISASHNPYYDNGLKVINGEGHKLEAEIEEKIEAYIDSAEDTLPYAVRSSIGHTFDYTEGRDRYVEYLVSLVKKPFDGIKIALDCSNGSASSVAKGIFERLGAVTYVINAEPDGENINNNCGSTHIEVLMDYVKQCGADIGFAFDGDADRCLAVDENGNMIDGDMIMYLCGCYMSECGTLNNNTVVTTVMSNIGLYKAFDARGISYEKTAVGDKYVYENMRSNGYSLGGEQSGHIIFSRYATTGDGLLTALMIMEAVVAKNVRVSELLSGLRIYPQRLVNVRVKDKKAALEDEYVKNIAARVEEELGTDGRLLLRTSGTEPVVRVMAEAETEEKCIRYTDRIVEALIFRGHGEQ